MDLEERINAGKQLRTDLFASSFYEMECDMTLRTITKGYVSVVYPRNLPGIVQP